MKNLRYSRGVLISSHPELISRLHRVKYKERWEFEFLSCFFIRGYGLNATNTRVCQHFPIFNSYMVIIMCHLFWFAETCIYIREPYLTSSKEYWQWVWNLIWGTKSKDVYKTVSTSIAKEAKSIHYYFQQQFFHSYLKHFGC